MIMKMTMRMIVIMLGVRVTVRCPLRPSSLLQIRLECVVRSGG